MNCKMLAVSKRKHLFWTSMLVAQAGAFLIFKDLADISQWVIQSSRDFTMDVWYNRYFISGISILALSASLFLWRRQRNVCNPLLLGGLIFFFVVNFYSGMINPRWMFRSQQNEALFVTVDKAPTYLQKSLHLAHFGPDSYASVDDINMVVLETDNGAYAYSDYYMLQPHVVKGDTIAGEEVIMTYCGLTNLGVAYSPVIGGKKLDLTAATQLKNNLVMADANSGELIQQLWGSMERDPTRQTMKEWPTVRMPFGAFRELYPQGKVYINEIADFGDNPVIAMWDRLVRHEMMLGGVGINWQDNDKPAFPTIEYTDTRLPMKELVYAISINNDHVAYSKDFLIQQGDIVNVEIGGEQVVVSYYPRFDSLMAFFNDSGYPVSDIDVFGRTNLGQQLSRVNTLKSGMFWFIFVEFYPYTDVNRI